MKKLNDCSTCVQDSEWHGVSSSSLSLMVVPFCEIEANLESSSGLDLGYPDVGELCPFYERVPGSDDDKE